MSKILRRVPLDFAWPQGEVWEGYVCPFTKRCPASGETCFGGLAGEGRWLYALAGFLLVLGEEGRGVTTRADFERLQREYEAQGRTYPHPYLADFTYPDHSIAGAGRQMVPPTHALFELASKLAGTDRAIPGAGFDSIARARAMQRLRRAFDLPPTWGVCKVCKGTDADPSERASRAAWTPREPPVGEGYQLWDDEAPRSPVFASLDALATWCATNATTFAFERASAEAWKEMLRKGFVHHAEPGALFC